MIKILDIWEEQNWNPSSRKQKSAGLVPAEIIKEMIIKEVFSKFPELVIDGPDIDIQRDEDFCMTYINIIWSSWIPTQINAGTVTFEKIKSGMRVQLNDVVLEDEPEWAKLHLKEVLIRIDEQLDKTKFEFYKKGIDPKQVQSYFKNLSKAQHTVFVQVRFQP